MDRHHPLRSTPSMVRGGWQVSASHSSGSIYTNELLAGAAPIHFAPDAANTIIGVWFAFDTAESGAGAGEPGDYTQLEFRVGNFAAYTTLATLDTMTNPAAGVVVRRQVYHQPQPGDTLFVYPSRVGTGSVNLDNAGIAFGFDLIGERIS